MPKFVIGDKVEIIEHPNKQYAGRHGRVIHIGTGIKGVTQPVNIELPKREFEPYYGVALDDGGEVHNLKEKQLRKL